MNPAVVPSLTHRRHFLVSTRAFRLLWLGYVAIYAFIALYFVVNVYFCTVAYSKPSFSYYVSTFRLLPFSGVPVASKTFQAVASLFVISLLHSLYQHPFRRQQAPPKPLVNESSAIRQGTASIATNKVFALARCVFSAPARYWGVHSALFEVATLLREAVEIGMQSVQAYNCSLATSNALLSITYGLLIPINCFSSPLIQRLTKHSDSARERAITLAVDLVLDLVWLTLPLFLMTTYFEAFLGSEGYLFRDTFMTRALTELQVMLVTSYGDLVLKIAPAISVWLTVYNIRKLVRCAPSNVSPSSPPVVVCASIAILPMSTVAIPTTNHGQPRHGDVQVRSIRTLLEMFLKWALVLWGSIVTTVYIVLLLTRVSDCESGCKLILRPWFSAGKCYCAVQEINCYSRGISGSEAEIRDALLRLNAMEMSSLIFTHCPQLHIPDTLSQFSHLFNLEIYNSTIESWSTDAMIDEQVFPQLGIVYLVLTGVTTVPEALLGPQLPRTLHEIAIIGSNLTQLPPSVVTDWHHIQTLYLDHGHFEIFPRELGQLTQLGTVSLNYNHIASIPDNALRGNKLNFLALNMNPLTRLPTQIGATANLWHVQIQLSNVYTTEGVPWLASGVLGQQFTLYGHGSPLCLEGEATSASPGYVVCSPQRTRYRGAAEAWSYYNLDGKIAERDPVSPLLPDDSTWA